VSDHGSAASDAVARDAHWGRRQILLLASVFFFVFLGAGAFQQVLAQALGGTEEARALRTTILAVTYGSFLLWRIGVAWTSRWLGEWGSIAVGAFLYPLLPLLVLLGAPAWLLIVGAAAWGWGAASLWVASGTRVLHVSSESRYGRGAATIYVGTLGGLALGLLVQSFLGKHWGTEAVVKWAAGVTLLGGAVALLLHRKGTTQEKPTWTVYRSLLLDRDIVLAGVMLFASGLTYPVLLSSFGDEVNLRGTIAAVGPVVLWFHVAKAILSYAGGRVSDRWGRGWTLSVGFLGGAVGLVLAGIITRTAGLAVAAFCLGIPSGMVPVVATALVGDKVKGPRRTMALGSLFVWRDAAVVAGLIGGEFLRRALQQDSYFVLAAVLVAFALAGRYLAGQRPTTGSQPEPKARSEGGQQ
jgi:predicted MFS family arabinose efflux permease